MDVKMTELCMEPRFHKSTHKMFLPESYFAQNHRNYCV